ncbi:MAG: hypothetical protein ACRENO_07115 [Thermodesulfobacteriota bacterium]
MKIMCWLDSEDYWYLNSMNDKEQSMDFFAYIMEVSEPEETNKVKILVVELISAKLVVGFAIPDTMKLDGEQELGFICQERPAKDIPFSFRLSDEVKKIKYSGDEIQKIEYAGFSLEKFYEKKEVKFCLFNLMPPKSENQDQP